MNTIDSHFNVDADFNNPIFNVAADDDPASPLPTTRTLYFRLLAGESKGVENLYFVHFSLSGPGGVLAFNFMSFLKG